MKNMFLIYCRESRRTDFYSRLVLLITNVIIFAPLCKVYTHDHVYIHVQHQIWSISSMFFRLSFGILVIIKTNFNWSPLNKKALPYHSVAGGPLQTGAPVHCKPCTHSATGLTVATKIFPINLSSFRFWKKKFTFYFQ